MTWTLAGAKHLLQLRVSLMSSRFDRDFRRSLQRYPISTICRLPHEPTIHSLGSHPVGQGCCTLNIESATVRVPPGARGRIGGIPTHGCCKIARHLPGHSEVGHVRRFILAAAVVAGAATICTPQQVETGFGEWQYQATALETSSWLLLYGSTDRGKTWIIGRKCGSNHRVLMAYASSQGDAADMGVVVRRRSCVVNWSTTIGCDLYANTTRYKTRYRIDDDEITWVNWHYGFGNAGIERCP